MTRPPNDLPEVQARQDAIDRTDVLAGRLIESAIPLMQQFGRNMRETLSQATTATTTAEIEDLITTVIRVGRAYGLELS